MTAMIWTQPTLFGETQYSVESISRQDVTQWLLKIHYAKRIPSISYSFGLYNYSDLVGVITYGTPATPSLTKGIAGEENASIVLELNRLVLLHNEPNEASRLIGASLRKLPQPSIVVSYADTAQNHSGKVYQATNWIYTGLSDAHAEWRLDGIETKHSRHLFDQVGGINNAKEIYGDRLQRHERSRKHRYLFIVANRTEKKRLTGQLRYQTEPYPK